jgi:LuxR family transcriptional regulator, maltose regulon positive regulatory protein
LQNLSQSMNPLLRTKITIPPITPRVVGRPRLAQYLTEGTQRALTLVVAPAGFGKTTLAATWAQSCQMPVAWLSLQPAERSPERFLYYLIQALRAIDPHIGKTTLALLGGKSPDGALYALVNDLAEIEHDFVLLLDDYHNADCAEIAEIIHFLLENRPAVFHLAIITRVIPSLNLTRLRALDQVVEITAAQLRFTAAETNQFFTTGMGLQLPAERLDQINQSTEGWAVGMQLAALALTRQPANWPAPVIQEQIVDYLAEEVLQRETVEVQDFLKKSALFDRFCLSLCVHALNSGPNPEQQQEKYQEMLAYIDRANLFLVPLDAKSYWYRYHGLFSDFLRRKMPLEQVKVIYDRASDWFESNGLIDEAIQYAIQANNYERAADLLENSYIDILAQGEQAAITEWTAAIPSGILDNRPRLWLAKGWASIISLDRLGALAAIEKVEAMIPGDQVHGRLGNELKSLQILTNILSGEMVAAAEISSIIRSLTERDDFLRSLLYFNLGGSQMFVGETAQAVNSFREAVCATQATNNPLIYIMAQAALGENLQLCGQLFLAEHTFLQAIGFAKKNLGEHTFLLGYLYNNYSELLREQNRLDQALHYAEMGISYCLVWQPIASLDSQIVLARLLAAQGKWEESYNRLELARQMMAESGLTVVDEFITAHMIRLMLLQGNSERARYEVSIHRLEENYANMLPAVRAFVELVLYRFKTTTASTKPAAACPLIEPLSEIITQAKQRQHVTRMIEALILRAYAQDSAGLPTESGESLGLAFSLGAHSGYVRIFADEGVRLMNLLEKRGKDIQAPLSYLEQIMGIMRKEVCRTTPAVVEIPEGLTSLTRRELDILALLSDGKSNQEIADERVLALSTVKKHVSNILNKLGVTNRTQAVMLAKKVGWLA